MNRDTYKLVLHDVLPQSILERLRSHGVRNPADYILISKENPLQILNLRGHSYRRQDRDFWIHLFLQTEQQPLDWRDAIRRNVSDYPLDGLMIYRMIPDQEINIKREQPKLRLWNVGTIPDAASEIVRLNNL